MIGRKVDIKQFVSGFPWIMRHIFKGQHMMITHKGEDLCAVIPAKDLRRLESFELEELERSEMPDAAKSLIRRLKVRDW